MTEFNQARNYVYYLLARRAYSQKEIITKLQAKNYTPETIAAVLDFCLEYNLLNDVLFAHKYIQSRQKSKGRKVLAWELRQKGLDEEIIAAELALLNSTSEYENAWQLAQKKARSLEPGNLSKVAAFLWRKGFDSEIIQQICQKLENS